MANHQPIVARRQFLPILAPTKAQFGRVPGKGTREAVLVATEIIARFHKATKGPEGAAIYRCTGSSALRIGEGFRQVDGPTAFAALSPKAQMTGLDM